MAYYLGLGVHHFIFIGIRAGNWYVRVYHIDQFLLLVVDELGLARHGLGTWDILTHSLLLEQ